MNRAVSFLVALFLVCPCAAADQGKSPDQSQESFVFGGRETRPGEFPWVVVILNKVVFDSTSFKDDKFNSQSCGGTLIAPSWVLTSAHCLVVINPDRFPTNIPRSPREILVALDVWDLEKEGGTFSEVERIIVHEDFAGTADAPTLGSDIALLKLVETFPDAPTVTLHTGDPLAFGTEHTIVGWGLSDPPGGFEFPAKQQQGEVKIVSNSTCQSLYFGIVEIEDSQICAGDLDTDVCFGDSGGPLLVQDPSPAGEEPGWVQIGITSFGVGCGDPTIPSVFARISSFSDWVAEQMQQTTLFATFGNGLTLSSDVVLYNPHEERTTRGTVVFKDSGGDEVDPALLLTVDSADFSIPPLGSMTFSSTGEGDLISGSVWVTSSHAVSGVVRFSLPGTGIAGVSPSLPGKKLIAPARRQGTVNTGVAVLNPGSDQVAITMELKNQAGDILGTAEIELGGMASTARFIDQLFPEVDTEGFQGTVCVKAQGGSVAVVAIEQGSTPGEFTTLQVTVVE